MESTHLFEESADEVRRDGAISPPLAENERVCRKAANSLRHHHSRKDFVDLSRAVNSSLRKYDPFPVNILAFIMVMLIKTIGFQVSLVIKFFTFPLLTIWLSYFSFMLLLCPFQTLRHTGERIQRTRKLNGEIAGWAGHG